MKNTYTAADKIAAQLTDTTDDYTVKYGDDILISADVVKGYLTSKYGEFYCSDLHTRFAVYQGIHNRDFARACAAFNVDYDPIRDIDYTETRATIDNHGTTTDTRKTDAAHNTVTAEALDGTKTESYTTTDDSDTARLETRDTSEGGTKTTDDLWTTTEKTRGDTSVTLDGFEYEGHDVHGETIYKRGDNGGHTTQSRLEEERATRLNPVSKNYLDMFIYENASYVGGAWSWL